MDELPHIPSEEENRKKLVRKRFKIVLIILNLVFLAELVYGLINIVYKQVKNANSCSVVNKINKNMDEYRFNNIAIRDYIIYGESLSVFRYDYDYEKNNDYFVKENSKFILKDLCTKKEYSFAPSTNLDQNIILSTLKTGNYYVFYQDDEHEYLLTYEVYDPDFDYSFYTLPYKKNSSDLNYTRKKIVISHVMSNTFPLMLIKVNEEKYIESELGYDIALDFKTNDQTKDIAYKLKNKFEGKGIRVLLNSNSEEYSYSEEIKNLSSIYDNEARFAIKIQTTETEVITFNRSSKIRGYMPVDQTNDEYNFIKQLGGRSLEAGLCNETSSLVSCSLGNHKDERGINSLVIDIPSSLDDDSLNRLVDNIYNAFINNYYKTN
ncbi:MAG: hypothetical protein E7184_00655 [Erysipelotrichaceae bacterium]|nr:hypothetical protein [Erysipelotrichaceae bacterium]